MKNKSMIVPIVILCIIVIISILAPFISPYIKIRNQKSRRFCCLSFVKIKKQTKDALIKDNFR
jgi:hypothetical protein